MIIVWMFTAPIHQAWLYSGQPLDWLDYLAAALFLVLLILESIADAQMWRFHQHKKRQMAAGIVVSQPFMADGLFRFCRHPNYFWEMGMWVTFYLFAISGSSQIWHWTGLGCLILILFFHVAPHGSRRVYQVKNMPPTADIKPLSRCSFQLFSLQSAESRALKGLVRA